MLKTGISIFIATMTLSFAGDSPGNPSSNPKELGLVHWQRDFDKALAESKSTGKPVLVLFQEIPGCMTCVRFGEAPLSHPLLVEAIETLFIPVAIYNNRPGKDAEILRRYDEPPQNFSVVRFLNATGKDIIPRQDNIWTTEGIATRMIAALRAANREAPKSLTLAAQETVPADAQKTTFAMHCYWTGEAKLGALDGVLSTRPGWLNDKEVVEVVFDPKTISYPALVTKAAAMECADTVFAHTDEHFGQAGKIVGDRVQRLPAPGRDIPETERKYYLKNSAYRDLALTPLQALRVNAALGEGQDPSPWLSPKQLEQVKSTQGRIAQSPWLL